MNLPNRITIARLILTVVIIVMLMIPYSFLGINVPTYDVNGVKVELTYIIAGVIFIIASLTDFLDGKIARKYNLVSEFGVKLDAVCYKIFAISLIIPALINHRIFIFNFVMEIAISYTNLLSYTKGNNPRSTIIGKIKTALLSLTLILAYIPNMDNLVIFIFSLITIICQVITLIKYINTDMEIDKKKKSSS